MQTLLFGTGLGLFLVGLITGFAVSALRNPRMGLTSHLEALLNGSSSSWSGCCGRMSICRVDQQIAAAALLVYGAWVTWLTTLLAALWGAGGPMMPLAASDRVGSAAQEAVVQAGLTTLAIADVLGVAIVLWGILIS